jgi:hypothetical protein
MKIFNLKKYLVNQQIFLFFVFCTFFPTLRLLLIGSEGSDSVYELAISLLPELFLLLIIFYFTTSFIRNKNEKLESIDWLIIIYIFYNIVIGTILAANLTVSIYAIRMTYLPMIFYFIFSLSLFKFYSTEILIDKIFKFMVFIGFLGIVLYFIFPGVMFYFLNLVSDEIGEYFIVRMTSVFWTPVLFGFLMSCSILYFCYRSFKVNSKIDYFYLTILFCALFFSVSRGALIASVLGILLLAILAKNWISFLKIVLLKIVVFIVVSFYVSNPKDFAYWLFNSSKQTVSLTEGVTRVELWKQAFVTAKENPFGLGLGKAGHVAERFFNLQSKNVSVTSTDGWFLKLLNETGFIGLIFYFGISTYIFIEWLKYIRKNSFDLVFYLGVIFIIANMTNLVSNVLDFYLFSYLYWLLLGVLVYNIKTKKIHA